MPIVNPHRGDFDSARSPLFLLIVFLAAAMGDLPFAESPRVALGAYDEMEVVDLSRERLNITKLLRQKSLTDEEAAAIDSFYRNFALPRWTLQSNRADLHKFSKELRNQLVSAFKTGGPHSRLNGLVLGMCAQMAWGENFHPGVRFNAMLAIGELNQAEPRSIGEAPKPLANVLPMLMAALADKGPMLKSGNDTVDPTDPDTLPTVVKAVTDGSFQVSPGDDVKQIDAVKIAALIGIHNHARFAPRDANGLPPQELSKTLIPPMLALATAQKPKRRPEEIHAWLQRQAMDVLGTLGVAGVPGAPPAERFKVAQTLAELVEDEKNPFSVRCTAAGTLGSLNYKAAGEGLKALPIVSPLGRLADDVCHLELERSKEDDKPIAARRLKTRLHSIFVGLGGIKPGVTEEPVGKHVDALREVVKNLVDLLEDEQLHDDKLKKEIKTHLTQLRDAQKDPLGKTPPAVEKEGKEPAVEKEGKETDQGDAKDREDNKDKKARLPLSDGSSHS